MDFFGAQDRARRWSRFLLLAIAAAVAAEIAAVYVVVHLLARPWDAVIFDPALAGRVVFVTAGVILAGSAWRTRQLRRGGHVIAAMMGGREIMPDTTRSKERQLFNVVEEMAIAAGVPVPRVFVLDDESGINAFAAGHSPDDAAIAISRGALARLTRDEIRAVVAHEIAHILNGDMRLNTWLVGLLYGILMPGVVGRGMVAGRLGVVGRAAGRAAPLFAVAGVLLIMVGQLGVWLGRLIQAAVNRQRELLADAAAVQFTREPDALTGALAKIGGLAFGSRMTHPNAAELAHLYVANGLAPPLLGLFATHPPLAERIRRIDPSFDGTFPATRTPPRPRWIDEYADPSARFASVDRSSAVRAPSGEAAIERLGAAALLASIGDPTTEHLDRAVHLLEELPVGLRDAAHDAVGAQAIVLALLVAHDAPTAADQAASAGVCDPAVAERFSHLSGIVASLPQPARIPLLELALPALRQLAPDQARRFRQAALNVIRARGTLRIFDLAVIRILDRRLGAQDGRPRPRHGGVHTFRPLRDDVEVLLSAVARAGTEHGPGDVTATAAFDVGSRMLPKALRLRLLPSGEASIGRVEVALAALERAAPALRKRILEACIGAIAYDAAVSPDEAELVRAVAEALDLPLPPAVETASSVR